VVVKFVDVLADLNSRLGVGLNFQSYSDRVGDARVAYDRIEADELDYDCINRVGVPAEKALQLYLDAYNIWNDCVSGYNCSNDSITPKLQRKWAAATAKLDKAKRALH
jgi:hypothetical protein